MRALQVGGRVDAELVGEVYAERLVPLERLGGTSRGIENVDEACPEALAQRMAFDQLAQPREAGCGVTVGEGEVDPAFEGLQIAFGDLWNDIVLDPLRRRMAERLRVPQCERVVENSCRLNGFGVGGSCNEPGESLQIHRFRR